jgi:hypothetical protein
VPEQFLGEGVLVTAPPYPTEGGGMINFSPKYRAAIERTLRAFVNDGDDVVCIGYFAYCYGNCKMCPKEGIKWHYVLENLRSQAILIVGSECVENYQVILSEWGYKPEHIVFPSFLRAYARWILEKNPNAVVFDDGIAMRFQAEGGAIMRANSQPAGLQHYRYAQRSQVGGAERVGGVDEAGRFYPIGPAVDYDYDAEYADYEHDLEEEDWEDDDPEAMNDREYDELDLAPEEGYEALSEMHDWDEDGAERED